jgi:hypothetical protein
MNEIQRYSNNLPAISKLGLTKHLFEQGSDDYNAVELIISMQDSGLNVKELSSYLDFIYRIDGHLSEIGYLKYVHNQRLQIEIDNIRFGSWEIVIERFLNTVDADKLAILFLALKFLPKIVQTFIDNIHKYYEILNTREDYLEKKDRRKNRKEIRDLINQEQGFSTLDKKQKEKLVTILEELFKTTEKQKIPASRFAQNSVKDVKLRSARKKNSS